MKYHGRNGAVWIAQSDGWRRWADEIEKSARSVQASIDDALKKKADAATTPTLPDGKTRFIVLDDD